MKTKVLFLLVVTTLNATGATIDTKRIDQITGLKGKLNEKEGAYKISFTREDIAVFVDGWKIPAFMGLSTWAAFTNATHSEAMVMGDTVLFEDEVNLAMFVALESGLSVTALHNHFFFDRPRLFFMHIEGEGTVSILPPPSGFSTTGSGSIAPLIQRRPILSSNPRCLTSAQ